MCHALAGSAFQFGIARFFLGAGESANFPAAFRTVADWFPQRERALAAGIFNSGSNIGALIAPLLVPFLAIRFGWHSAFIFTGALGFVWLVCWLIIYRQPEHHTRLSSGELALITSSSTQAEAKIPWKTLLTRKQAWAFLIGKVFTDPVWWFYLYWTPDFLHRKYGLNMTELGLPLVVIYLFSDFGSIGGGWLSSSLLKRGWPASSARKFAMLICALCVLSAVFVPYTGGNLALTVILIAIAASAHQGWSANLFTIPSDTFPRSAVASVIGLGGFGGALAGMVAAPAIGVWLKWSHDRYAPLFIAAGLAYLLALAYHPPAGAHASSQSPLIAFKPICLSLPSASRVLRNLRCACSRAVDRSGLTSLQPFFCHGRLRLTRNPPSGSSHRSNTCRRPL